MSETNALQVLIALGDPERAAALRDRFEIADVSAHAVEHGVQCLERALSERPRIVVAELGLPLLDASRLAEILRANPRTQFVRFLFLGDAATLGSAGGVGDCFLPSDCEAEEVVAAVEALLERQGRAERLRAGAAEGQPGEGDLAQLPLAELLELLSVSGQTRMIAVERETETGPGASGSIEVVAGEIVRAAVDNVSGEKALFRMLGWREGHFAIEPCEPSGGVEIRTPARALMKEGLRQLSETERHARSLPPLDGQIRLRVARAELPAIVHPLTQDVLLLTELYRSVGDVVDHCSYPDYQVLRTLRTLAEREILSIGRAPVPGHREPSGGLFNDAQQRRICDWVSESGCVAPSRGKLLITSSEPGLTLDFARLISHLDGVKLSAECERGEIGPYDLAALAEIEACGEPRLDLLQVPSAPRYAGMWPRVGHGALGALMLLAPPVAESRERLVGFVEALRRAPRSRLFHVVLLPKGEYAAAEELSENLALLDDGSLFLLPQDDAKDPAPLLRSLFARLVP